VAFLGLGVMGGPMAGHLARAGHQVTVFTRTLEKAKQWVLKHKEFKVGYAPTAADAAKGARFVLACVGADEDVRQVTIGPKGAFQNMTSGSIFIDHTTASAKVAREVGATAKTKGIAFIDAPVSGGQAGAENGALSIMCGAEGGEEEGSPFALVKPILTAYGKTIKLIGPIGSGQLTKMVNQICIAGTVQGLSEGLHFAQRAGLDTKKVVDVIQHGAAGSWQMANRSTNMVGGKFDYGFAVNWMRKDLDIALTEAKANGSHLPLTALVDQFYSDVQAMGGGRWDTSSLITRLTPPVPPKSKL